MTVISGNNEICTICSCGFDPKKDGGICSNVGNIAVQFCPTCMDGIWDFADQTWGMVEGIIFEPDFMELINAIAEEPEKKGPAKVIPFPVKGE